MTLRLALIVIRVQELERAAAFYGALGLVFAREKHGSGPEHLSCYLGGVVFELYPRRSPEDSTSATRLGFAVDGMEDVLTALESLSTRVTTPPADGPWGRRAVVVDPDGHTVEIFEARGRDAAPRS